MIEYLKLLCPVENSRMLTPLFTIIATNTNVIIARHHSLQILQLRILTLLCTENIKAMELDQLSYVGATLPPAIAIDRITFIRVTNIICTHDNILCRTHA